MKRPCEFGQLVGAAVQKYIDKTVEANMPLNVSADMVLVSRPTLYAWRKNLPDGSIPLNLLLNVLEGTNVLDAALASGRLPAKGRKDAAEFVVSVLENRQ